MSPASGESSPAPDLFPSALLSCSRSPVTLVKAPEHPRRASPRGLLAAHDRTSRLAARLQNATGGKLALPALLTFPAFRPSRRPRSSAEPVTGSSGTPDWGPNHREVKSHLVLLLCSANKTSASARHNESAREILPNTSMPIWAGSRLHIAPSARGSLQPGHRTCPCRRTPHIHSCRPRVPFQVRRISRRSITEPRSGVNCFCWWI